MKIQSLRCDLIHQEIGCINMKHQDSIQNFDLLPDAAFVRLPVLLKLYACSPATIWRGVESGRIPKPKKLSPRVTAWNVGKLREALNETL